MVERKPEQFSEDETRKHLIDKQLRAVDWKVAYIKAEVNSVKSDFNAKMYTCRSGEIERGVDKFIDYVLLADDYSPLAIIEAKKFSRDPEVGRIQARTYAKDIEKQIHEKVSIFLTNGERWYFIDHSGVEREIRGGVFSQDDLKRRRELYRNERNPAQVKINQKIVDRPRSLSVLRELSEHFGRGHRKALIQMATGTGKTRVAMGLIDLLIQANMVRNVLFIADRIALANQAKSDGFKQFFNEPVVDLRDGISTTGRFYISTIQTLMGGKGKKFFEKLSPGFFDLIIFDEAHRSIYDKNGQIMQYFDAIMVGLTATPREHESKNTYALFECEDGRPTVEYSYNQAVLDGVLVPYKAFGIQTAVLSLGIEGHKLSKNLQDELRKQETEPETATFTGSEFDKTFMDEKTNELVIREFMLRCYKSDEGKPAKTIVFCASQRHANFMKKMFNKLFPRFSDDVQVITSNMSRAEDEVRRFKLDSEPRIALSVGMLDTGIDVPEVCNLVFVKPVFSSVRFWQMLGRGTRNLNSCKHKDWLPDRNKQDFLILDFMIGGHSNIEFHKLHETKEQATNKDVITKIFLNRAALLKRDLTEEEKKIILEKVNQDIDALHEESFLVREKSRVIKKLKKNKFELDKYVDDLEKEIAPLLITRQGIDPKISGFILAVERLFNHILDNKLDSIEKVREYVQERLEKILQKDNLTEVKQKKPAILKVMQEKFWDDVTFESVEFIIKEIAPLMKYYQSEGKKIVLIDAPDMIIDVQEYEKEVKEDTKLTEMLAKNAVVQKIKKGEGITVHELKALEQSLLALRPELTIENVQQYQKKDFLTFIKEIIGLTQEYDPRVLIEREFDKYVVQNNTYNSRQLEFLQLLKKVFAEHKSIELADFAKPPLANERPADSFSFEQLQAIVVKCNEIRIK